MSELTFWCEYFFLGVYIAVTIFCNLYGFCMLRKPGISKMMKMSFLKYQVLYASIGFVCNTAYVARDFYLFLKYMHGNPEGAVLMGMVKIDGR
jgi:hypothetical protein